MMNDNDKKEPIAFKALKVLRVTVEYGPIVIPPKGIPFLDSPRKRIVEMGGQINEKMLMKLGGEIAQAVQSIAKEDLNDGS